MAQETTAVQRTCSECAATTSQWVTGPGPGIAPDPSPAHKPGTSVHSGRSRSGTAAHTAPGTARVRQLFAPPRSPGPAG
eukprot:CAMPEP_0173193254 /NCGR_PEP_ID=MMETSP1141-20130122/13861_1 /TAXON_ID=483371 /ORGANISM="non described non described, Strain CCMP2298" /LENGTH=78 /DNA_ID=CAMNT_0014117579 /DNA_START=54 /DNA_END=290 /DNA_ORIENTATION=+